MKIDYGPVKRNATLEARGLDMADALYVFEGAHITIPDLRFEYGEDRFLTIGRLRGRMVVLFFGLARQRHAHHQHEEGK